jgi:hypothetical protein
LVIFAHSGTMHRKTQPLDLIEADARADDGRAPLT